MHLANALLLYYLALKEASQRVVDKLYILKPIYLNWNVKTHGYVILYVSDQSEVNVIICYLLQAFLSVNNSGETYCAVPTNELRPAGIQWTVWIKEPNIYFSYTQRARCKKNI